MNKRLTSSAKEMVSKNTWKKIGAMFLGGIASGAAAGLCATIPSNSSGIGLRVVLGTLGAGAVAVGCFANGHENAGAAATLVTATALLGGGAGFTISRAV